MTPEVRLGLIERRKTMLHALPAPRVQVRDRREGTAQFVDHDEDNLRAARGILTVTLISIGFWMAIGLIVWIIAH